MIEFLHFAADFGPWKPTPPEALPRPEDRLFWKHTFTTTAGLHVRVAGLNTALLAADDNDLAGSAWVRDSWPKR